MTAYFINTSRAKPWTTRLLTAQDEPIAGRRSTHERSAPMNLIQRSPRLVTPHLATTERGGENMLRIAYATLERS
jgi:hypothetical protein